MKSLVIVSIIVFGAPAFASTSDVKLTSSKRDTAESVLRVSGSVADKMFDQLSDSLMDSTDAESSIGRPVWKTGKNVYCLKHVMGTRKVPTTCEIHLNKNSGTALDLQN